MYPSLSGPNMQSLIIPEKPMIAVSGVRNSWLILTRNSDFALLAASAACFAAVRRGPGCGAIPRTPGLPAGCTGGGGSGRASSVDVSDRARRGCAQRRVGANQARLERGRLATGRGRTPGLSRLRAKFIDPLNNRPLATAAAIGAMPIDGGLGRRSKPLNLSISRPQPLILVVDDD